MTRGAQKISGCCGARLLPVVQWLRWGGWGLFVSTLPSLGNEQQELRPAGRDVQITSNSPAPPEGQLVAPTPSSQPLRRFRRGFNHRGPRPLGGPCAAPSRASCELQKRSNGGPVGATVNEADAGHAFAGLTSLLPQSGAWNRQKARILTAVTANSID